MKQHSATIPSRRNSTKLVLRRSQAKIQLMAKKYNLGFKPAPRLDHIGDKHFKRTQDRKHCSS
jgi:hypothetical protein